MTVQWTPLVMCSAFFPLALAFCVAKPQIGTPVALTHSSRTGWWAAAFLLLVSFALRPCWPLEWIPQIHGYQRFVPLLVGPGPLAGPGALAVAGPRRPAPSPGLRSAAALVLRFVHLVADSENAPEHCGHRGLQLGSRALAFVSHAAHDAASRSLVRPGLLCSDADCGLASSAM
jgi:hypothetical protein